MALSDADRLAMLAPPRTCVRAVLDTDTYNEIDDQFAVVQALLSPDRIGLEAIYAAPFHNTRSTGPRDGMEKSYDEILALLDRMNRPADGLVHKGVEDYVGPAEQRLSAPAVDDLIDRARTATPGEPLYVIAIAVLSNIASALLKAPDIADRIVLVWLGGHALTWPDTAEFNLMQDVRAAQIVFDSGMPVVLLPCMGVVSHLHASVAEIERYVEPHGAIGAFLAERFKGYGAEHKGWSKQIWDMAAVAWVLNDAWAPGNVIPAPILNDPPRWSFDAARHGLHYVHWVDRDAILRDFYDKLEAFAARPGP
ncbi:MAG: nucleoside hydrolase [Paracoccaceae bacterium]|nr:nucleoside hydrolase [Paracoccaceae bacterium]